MLYAFDDEIGGFRPLCVSGDGGATWDNYGTPAVLLNHMQHVPDQPERLINIAKFVDADGERAMYTSADMGKHRTDTGIRAGDAMRLRLVDMDAEGVYFYERYEDNHDVALDGLWWTGDGFETYSHVEFD